MRALSCFVLHSSESSAFAAIHLHGHGQSVKAAGHAPDGGGTIEQRKLDTAHARLPVAGRLRKRRRRREALLLAKLTLVPENKGVRSGGGGHAPAGCSRAAARIGGQRGLAGALAARRASGLVLEVGFQMLLHVVGSGELLVASRILAMDCLFRCVDLGVARSVTRGGEGLFAPMKVTVAAGVPLDGALGDTRCSGAVLFARGWGAARPVGRALSGRAFSVVAPEGVSQRPHASKEAVSWGRQGRDGGFAELRVEGVRSEERRGVW